MDVEFMTFERAMEYLGISKGQLYNYTHQRKFRYFRPTGRRLYFLKSDLDEFISSNPIAPATEINEAAHQVVRKMNKQ